MSDIQRPSKERVAAIRARHTSATGGNCLTPGGYSSHCEVCELFAFMDQQSAPERPAKHGPCPNCGATWVSAELKSSQATDLPKPINHDLWRHLHDEHGLTLLQSELDEILRLAQPPVPAHSDDLAVDRFAAAMKAKLAKKRAEGRGGWDNPDACSIEYLQTLLHEHVPKGDMVDIGNFAMMLWNRFKSWDDAARSRPTKGESQ